MSGATPQDARSGAEERRLALAAAGGDGHAFAQLYDNYEKRIYNYCLRLLGDRHEAEDATQEAFLKVLRRLPEMGDPEFEFGPYLFTTARNTSYDMIGKQNRTEVMDEVPETGGGHLHKDGLEIESDPARSALLESQRELVREANERLPVRQREVLVLREVEGLSYDEIAATMEMKSNAVAQLISRARTNLRGEMRLGAASGVTPDTPECEKALPLLAARADRELKDPADRIWLETHLAGCERCRLSDEAMAEAGLSYRAWAPVVPAAYLFRDTLAKAAGVTGSDWSGIARPAPIATPGVRNRSVLAGAALGAVLVVALISAVLAGQVDDATIDTAAPDPASAPRSVLKPEDTTGSGRGKADRETRGGEPERSPDGTGTEVEITEVTPDNGSVPSAQDRSPDAERHPVGKRPDGDAGDVPVVADPKPDSPRPEPEPAPEPEPQPEPEPEPEPEPPVVPPDRPNPPTRPTPGGPNDPAPG